MLVIDGRVYVNMQIDQHYLDYAPNLFSTLVLTESVAGLFPAASFVFNDFSGQLNRELALTEGNEILITVGKTPNDLNNIARQYRVFQLKHDTSNAGPTMTVNCIYDAPKYISEAARDHYQGTSSQVLQQIAQQCGLYYCGPESYNGKSMNDAQSWWNIGRSRAAFAQYNVARHGYMDPHSAMCSALTSMGEIRYRNLMDVIETPLDKIKYVFAHIMPVSAADQRTVYLVDEARAHSDAGLMNNWQNYGSTRVVHNQSGEFVAEESMEVKMSGGRYLTINDQVAQTIGRARFDHSLLDCGNVHEKYERAFYQNIKHMCLFSERMSLLVSDPTAVQLFDPVLYLQSSSDPSRQASTSDVYIVIGKTIYIKGGSYYSERLELVRMSITEEGESNMKCVITPDTARSSTVPNVIIDPTSMGITSASQANGTGVLGVAGKQLGVAQKIQAGAAPLDRQTALAKSSSILTIKAVVNAASSALKIAALVKQGPNAILSNPSLAISALSNASSAILQYNAAVGGFTNQYAQSGVHAVAYANTVLRDPMFSQAVRVLALSKPGGLADNHAAMLGALSLNNDMYRVFNSGRSVFNTADNVSVLSGHAGGKQALDGFNSSLDALTYNTQQMNRGMIDMWNGSMSLATGQAIPPAVQRDNSASIYSLMDNSLSPPSTYLAKVKSVSDLKTEFTNGVLTPNDDRTLKWGDAHMFNAYSLAQPFDVEAVANSLEPRANLYQAQQAHSYAV